MIVHREFGQNSLEWLQARSGVVTASEFDNLVTPKWKVKTGDGPRTYLARKLAEWWLGGSLPSFQSIDMDLGQILEGEALPWFELETSLTVERVGFITTNDGRVGCSPDGLLADGTGIEVKCPAIHTHVRYLLEDVVPEDYLAQVHGAMLVTGAPSWKFISYCRRFPALLLHVERDESIQEVLWSAIDNFMATFEEAKKRLEDINGGPPRRFTETPLPACKPTTTDETDIIP